MILQGRGSYTAAHERDEPGVRQPAGHHGVGAQVFLGQRGAERGRHQDQSGVLQNTEDHLLC